VPGFDVSLTDDEFKSFASSNIPERVMGMQRSLELLPSSTGPLPASADSTDDNLPVAVEGFLLIQSTVHAFKKVRLPESTSWLMIYSCCTRFVMRRGPQYHFALCLCCMPSS